MRRAVRGHPWAVIGLVALVALAWWAIGTRSQEHHLRAAFPTAVSVIPGLDVQIDGVDVGKVTGVDYVDGRAVVGIGIDRDDAWPLHRGTTATQRFGTTIGNGTRRIDLEPGPRSAPELPEGGIIEAEDTSSPVEFDEVFNALDRDTRSRLRGLLEGGEGILRGRERRLNRGIVASAPALEGAGRVLAGLATDERALSGLVANGDRATRVLATRARQVQRLVSASAATFDELAGNSRSVQASLVRLPRALREIRSTLRRLDRTSAVLDRLVADARPGAARLPELARAARPAIRELGITAPVAVEGLRGLREAAPDVTRLLRRGVPFSADLRTVLERSRPAVRCLRPYAPELVGFLSNFSSLSKNFDSGGHYARFHILQGPSALGTADLTSASLTRASGLSYRLPRPPGDGVGQPWLQPSCGAGEAALDPAQDPEDRR